MTKITAPIAPPSAWRMEHAMSVLMSARARIADEDPDLLLDEAQLIEMLGDNDEQDALALLDRMIRAAAYSADMAAGAKVAKESAAARQARYQRRHDAAKSAAAAALEALGISRREQPDFTFYLQRGKPSVIITDEAKLADRFVKIERTPKRADIAEALADGEVIEGATLGNAMTFPVLKRT